MDRAVKYWNRLPRGVMEVLEKGVDVALEDIV